MKKRIILALLSLMLSFCSASAKEETKWGVVFINGKAAYVDPSQLDMSEIMVPNYIIEKNKKMEIKNTKYGRITWGESFLQIVDIQTYCPPIDIEGSLKEYKYKVEHNVMFLSEDGKTWEVLQISVVDDKEKQIGDKHKYPQHMIIHLKCKWFENDYALIGTMGS